MGNETEIPTDVAVSTAPEQPVGPDHRSSRPRPWRLFALSGLTLFVELALIRWTAANNVQLGEITNFVLLASFLGVGLGFLRSHRRPDLFRWVPLGLAVLVAFVLLFPVKLVTLKGTHPFDGLPGHGAVSEWVTLPIIFGLVVLIMAGLGQAMARSFSRFRPLDAYRLDILGSIGGIALFSVLSLAGLPPIAWGAVVAALLLVLLGSRRWLQWVVIAALVLMLGFESASTVDVWSPYYKITTAHVTTTVDGHHYRGLAVWGNNIPYQTLYSVPTLRAIEPFYFFPYGHVARRSLANVLVIGAGTGNDVAIALSEGARHVDAVEIDPDLVQIGEADNPEHAYENPRVTVHIDDGRAFLQDTDQRYNLILYALPDSLTALSGQSAPVGLENYLLTSQAIDQARQHLAPGGTFAMYNYYQPFLLNRYATTITQAFGTRPCVQLGNSLAGRQQAVLSVNRDGPAPHCASPWRGRPYSTVSDDRPYPYLPGVSIPTLYLVVLGLILAASLVLVRLAGGRLRRMVPFVDLFFMGAAFMLLESKSIVQFALYFGTTWYVNSLVFAGVLLSVYAAVEVARHVRLPRPLVLYGALLVALAVSFVVPEDALLGLPVIPRFVAAVALAFSPVFTANLVFAQRFQDVGSSTTGFGANLLGAMVGGVLEYLSLVTGFRDLLFLVALLYGLAFFFGRSHLVGST